MTTTHTPDQRCRLVLVLNTEQAKLLDAQSLSEVLKAGDIASLIFTSDGLEDAALQDLLEPLVQATQEHGVAAIIADSTRVAGRCGADGFQLGQDPQAVAEAIDKFAPKIMVGVSNVKTRHNALVIGELQPDYVMFGKPGGDIRPEPHPKNLDMGKWWSSMVEIPCIVMGGSDIQCVAEVSQCGAEFVALGAAIFAPQDNAHSSADLVRMANNLLDEHAPIFEISAD